MNATRPVAARAASRSQSRADGGGPPPGEPGHGQQDERGDGVPDRLAAEDGIAGDGRRDGGQRADEEHRGARAGRAAPV
ncbi:hypothetical protein [Actinomadura madurae]|uniref:hypothetical protein n=1 Tax=Actinomadura madurae TaxID=1993 RepID=UPI0020D208E4|nr:hypothetical protein [Actinomadura madurae]MCQ0008992.1 hypothetical protein [Actinomadura madurae]